MAVDKVIIYGDRGFGREVHQLIKDLRKAGACVSCVGFLVDAEFRQSEIARNPPVLGGADWLASVPDVRVVIAIGSTAPRHRIARLIEDKYGTRSAVLRHPRAWIGDDVAIGEGSIVCAGAVMTTNIAIGRHVQIHVNATVGHDTTLGNFVTVAPGANVSGRVEIGEGAFVGVGAVIVPDIKIGRWSIVGAGAVVTKDVPSDVTVAGSPAKVIAERPPGWHLDPSRERQRL
jgi:sugar O-acyltransferase (sialic acid O-acetyltransferase NeuD family)